MSGSGISWALCKSAPCSRQTTTPAPHHSCFFYRPYALPAAQQHQSTEGTLFTFYTTSEEKKNTNCCTAALALYLLLFSASYYLHSPRTASGARYSRCACIDMDMLRLWGSGLLRHGLNFSTVWCTVQLISVEDWKHTLMQKVFRVTTFCIKTCFHSFLTLIGQGRN